MSGLNVVLAGGGSGIGLQAVADLLQHTAARLVVLDPDVSRLAVLEQKYPGRLWTITGDITKSEDRERTKELALRKLQRIESLVITSGVIGELQRIASLSPDRLARTFDINVFGPLLLCQALLGELRKTKGTIILLSSAIDKNVTYAGWNQYAASKAALSRSVEILAHEEPFIKVLGVYPGLTRTPMPTRVIAGDYKGIMYDFEVAKFKYMDETGKVEPAEWCASAVAQLAAGVAQGLPSGRVAYYHEHVPRCKDGWPKQRDAKL